MVDADEVATSIIGAAIAVHRELGPGLLESTYETCTAWELERRGVRVERQKKMRVDYGGVRMECGYRLDLLVDSLVVVEIKSVEKLERVHTAQMLTYLKLSGCPLGLLINFNVPLLKNGIRRISLAPLSNAQRPPCSPR